MAFDDTFNVIMFVVSIFLLIVIIWELRTGKAYLRFAKTYSRKKNPVEYWTAIAIESFLVVLFLFLFFRVYLI